MAQQDKAQANGKDQKILQHDIEEIDKKDENGNDVVIKQFHHCSWSNSNNRWESSTFKQDGSKDKDWYWDNSNSKFVER